jgi:uracil-DNA glycosylase
MKKVLGEQIHGHLKLYKDLGVRYVSPAKPKKRTAAAKTSKTTPTENPYSEKPPSSMDSFPKTATGTSGIPQKNMAVNPEETLEAILADIGDCRRCKLAPTRKNLVFGSGNPHAELMFVGEAPGADEDEQGLPFVGRAGQLLTRIIEAIELRRQDVFICNILKCRPPGNRNPETDEIAACEGFLFRQIEAVKPKVIVTLGAFGAQTLLRTTEAIGRLRGRLIDYRGIKLMATFHPAYLLRNPIEKRKVWEDMQIVRDYIRSLHTSQS